MLCSRFFSTYEDGPIGPAGNLPVRLEGKFDSWKYDSKIGGAPLPFV